MDNHNFSLDSKSPFLVVLLQFTTLLHRLGKRMSNQVDPIVSLLPSALRLLFVRELKIAIPSRLTNLSAGLYTMNLHHKRIIITCIHFSIEHWSATSIR